MRILVNEHSDRNLLERRLTNQSEEAWKSNEVCLKYWNGEVSSSGLWEENFRDSICWYKLPFFWAKKKSLDKKSVLCDAVIVNFSSIRYLFFKSFSLTVYESAKWQIFVSPSRLLRNLEQKKNEACLFLNEGKKRKIIIICFVTIKKGC